jgi:alpha-glucosidase
MDLVVNHLSTEHRWFQEALAAAPGSPERARFYFEDGRDGGESPPNNWLSWFGGSAWRRVIEPGGRPGQWYLCLFTPQQADLRWTNPEVGELFAETMEFWADRGVDGFRVDAPIVSGKEPSLADAPADYVGSVAAARHNPMVVHRPELAANLAALRRGADRYNEAHPGRELFLVGETFTPSLEILARYVGEHRFHQTFDFDLLLAPWDRDYWHRRIADAFEVLEANDKPLAWALNNHDAQRIVTRLGRSDATDTRVSGDNLINSTAAVDEALGLRRARAAALIATALFGAVYLYQGEELGLPDGDMPDEARQDPVFHQTNGEELGRDGCRVPLPWDAAAGANLGFSPPESAPAWLPQQDDWSARSAAVQAEDPDSTLSLYRAALAERRSFVDTDFVLVESSEFVDEAEQVLAFRRGDLVVLTNFSDRPVTITADLTLVLASSADTYPVLPDNSSAWLRATRPLTEEADNHNQGEEQ